MMSSAQTSSFSMPPPTVRTGMVTAPAAPPRARERASGARGDPARARHAHGNPARARRGPPARRAERSAGRGPANRARARLSGGAPAA